MALLYDVIKEKYQSFKSGFQEMRRDFFGVLFDGENYFKTKKMLHDYSGENSGVNSENVKLACSPAVSGLPSYILVPYHEDKREKKTLAEHYIRDRLDSGKDVSIPSLNIILKGKKG